MDMTLPDELLNRPYAPMRPCVTHHFACDCRERQFDELREELTLLRAVEEAARPLGEALYIDITVQDEARFQVRRRIDALAAWRSKKGEAE